MNKTPIQELIELYSEKYKHAIELLDTIETEFNQVKFLTKSSCYRDTITQLTNVLQKEKQFAFECFESGMAYNLGSHELFKQTHPDFEQFYSQYAERGSK